MKKILNIALAATLLFGFSSCEDWLDVNTSPDAPVTVTCDVVLPSVLFYASQQVFDFTEYGVYLSQCLTTTGKSPSSSTAYKSGWGGFLTMNRHPQWRRCYYDIGVNTTYMLEDAEVKNARNYILIGKTLLINSLLTTTDLFGDVPVHETYAYSTSVEGRSANPRYEPQADVYAYIEAEFKDLLAKYEDPEWINCPTNGNITEQADRMFGGDLNKWRALTKALYARFLLRNIPNMNNTPAMCDKIIAAVDAAISDPGWQAMTNPVLNGARAAIYKYDGGSAEKNCPWGPSQPKMNLGWAQARENLLTSAVPSSLMGAIMGFYGRGIPFGRSHEEYMANDEDGKINDKRKIAMYALDPRAPRMFEPRKDDAGEIGLRSIKNNIGMDIQFGTTYKMDYFPDLYTTSDKANPYTRDDGYIAFITEEELLFAKAEALYWKGSLTEAYDVTVQAVETSFRRYGVYGNVGRSEVASIEKDMIALFKEFRLPAPVSGGQDGFSIAHLMQQKYVAMYLQPEQWNDIRRYNYSSSANGIMYGGQYVYNVAKVFDVDQKWGNITKNQFSDKNAISYTLVRPYNIYTAEWDTPLDKGVSTKLSPWAWLNRISADPETEEKYNRDELIRIGAYKNPNWLRKRQVWQLPLNPGTAITNYGDSEDWARWE